MYLNPDSNLHSLIGHILVRSRLSQLYQKLLNGSQIVILTYHRVCPRSDSLSYNDGMAVTPAMFEQQVAHLRHECTILSLRQVTGFIKETKRFPVNSVVITFDDGYLDNYTYAFPILEKYNVPATIFLTTDFVNGDSLLWWDELSQLIKYASRSFCTIHLRGVNRIIKVETEQQNTRAYKHLVKVLRDVKEISQVEVLNPIQVKLTFTEAISDDTGQNINYYSIKDQGGIELIIHRAIVQPDAREIILFTSELTEQTLYYIIVAAELTDLWGNPHKETPGLNVSFKM